MYRHKTFLLISIIIMLMASTINVHASQGPEYQPPLTEPECYMILAGKDATVDGSVLLAHNNDLLGNNASLLEKIPRQRHEPRDIVSFPSGLEIPQVDETYEWLVLKIYKGFAEGDAIAVNEYQVSIAGGVALGSDRNKKAQEVDPLESSGLTGGIRYVVLERSKTAREAVELLGEMYSKYGVTYPSGVGVADANEVWYIEPGGGHTWAAIRIPDDSVMVIANGYRIQEIDPSDTKNVIVSPGLLEFTQENGLWDPTQGPFNFAKAFGREKQTVKGMEFYDSRRVWSGLRLLKPSVDWDPNQVGFPMFVVPDKKITMEKLIEVLRDQYDGTKYDINPPESPSSGERAIAVPNCVHTNLVQLRNWLPADVGAVIWAGLGSSLTAPYIPYYFGITEIPEAYSIAGAQFDARSAFWTYRALSTLITPYYNLLGLDVRSQWEAFEADMFSTQPFFEKAAIELFNRDKYLAKKFLTNYSNGLSLKALDKAQQMVEDLQTKIAESGHLW